MFVLKYIELTRFRFPWRLCCVVLKDENQCTDQNIQEKTLLFCYFNLMAYAMKPFVAYSSNPIILSQLTRSVAERINLVGWLRECEKIRINYVTLIKVAFPFISSAATVLKTFLLNFFVIFLGNHANYALKIREWLR